MDAAFWIFLFIIFYAFAGYGIVLYTMVVSKRIYKPGRKSDVQLFEPEVTLLVNCIYDSASIADKIKNYSTLDYPKDKLSLVFITQGTADQSDNFSTNYPGVKVVHENSWVGNAAAKNRAMKIISTPFVIFCEANTMLNTAAVKNIVRHFADEKVSCVAGEKKIHYHSFAGQNTFTKGVNSKYQSLLKSLDSELNSTCGVVEELVAFRCSKYQDLPGDTLLENFMQSMQMAADGNKIMYEPNAYAMENALGSVADTFINNSTIAAGAWQSILRLSGKLSFTKTPLLYFQYVSQRLLRWTVVSFLLIAIFFLNIPLTNDGNEIYEYTLLIQLIFYSAAMLGYILESSGLRVSLLMRPYYFCLLNYALIVGLCSYLAGKKGAAWQKEKQKVAMA